MSFVFRAFESHHCNDTCKVFTMLQRRLLWQFTPRLSRTMPMLHMPTYLFIFLNTHSVQHMESDTRWLKACRTNDLLTYLLTCLLEHVDAAERNDSASLYHSADYIHVQYTCWECAVRHVSRRQCLLKLIFVCDSWVSLESHNWQQLGNDRVQNFTHWNRISRHFLGRVVRLRNLLLLFITIVLKCWTSVE